MKRKGREERQTSKGRRKKEITRLERCITSSASARLVYLSLTARGSHWGPQPDRDKLAGWMGHDSLKRYRKDTTSSSILCCSIGARRHPGCPVTAASWRQLGQASVQRSKSTTKGITSVSKGRLVAHGCVVNWSRAKKLLSWGGFHVVSVNWANVEIKKPSFLNSDASFQVWLLTKLHEQLYIHVEMYMWNLEY